jgi:hypothetical protein
METCKCCLGDIQNNEIDISCGHTFHKKCIKEWVDICKSYSVHPTCPFCRVGLDYNSLCITLSQESENLFMPNLINGLVICDDRSLGYVEESKIVTVKLIIGKNSYFSLDDKSNKPAGSINRSRIDNICITFRDLKPETHQPYGTINWS